MRLEDHFLTDEGTSPIEYSAIVNQYLYSTCWTSRVPKTSPTIKEAYPQVIRVPQFPELYLSCETKNTSGAYQPINGSLAISSSYYSILLPQSELNFEQPKEGNEFLSYLAKRVSFNPPPTFSLIPAIAGQPRNSTFIHYLFACNVLHEYVHTLPPS